MNLLWKNFYSTSSFYTCRAKCILIGHLTPPFHKKENALKTLRPFSSVWPSPLNTKLADFYSHTQGYDVLKQGLQPGEENHRSNALKGEASNKQKAVAERPNTAQAAASALQWGGQPPAVSHTKQTPKNPKSETINLSKQHVGLLRSTAGESVSSAS